MIQDILSIMANTAVIYIIVLIGLRILGKKDLGQLSVTDILFIMLVSEAVGDVMRASHDSLLGAITAALTLIILNKIFNLLVYKSKKFRDLVDGKPSILVRNGEMNHKEMHKNRISVEDLEQAGRESGKSSISQIPMAVLEVDGKISILDDDQLQTAGAVEE